jgi:cytoskeletal protein CcmA (bactofilin family)
MSWFGRSSRPAQHEALESAVGATSSFQGILRSDGGVRIDGTFEGAIEVAGNVVIGQGARVVADVVARNLTVGGALKGNVDCAGQLQILSTGQVFGDIAVASVMIDDGGVFQGSSHMRGIEQLALPAPRAEGPATIDAAARVEPVIATVRQPAVEPVIEDVREVVIEPTREPVVEPVREPVIEPVREPVIERVRDAPAKPSTRPAADAPRPQVESRRPTDTPRAVVETPPPAPAPAPRRDDPPTVHNARRGIDIVRDDLGLDLDRLNIEPVIPDMTAEDAAETPPVTSSRQDRRAQQRRGRRGNNR